MKGGKQWGIRGIESSGKRMLTLISFSQLPKKKKKKKLLYIPIPIILNAYWRERKKEIYPYL